jgi:lipopolysaccharide/colanic/teichoic acid biosynthesis glycosyltransferase
MLGTASSSNYEIKPGVVGYIQINQNRIQNSSDEENYLLYYLQNYSIWLDIDILMKSIFSTYNVLDDIENKQSI